MGISRQMESLNMKNQIIQVGNMCPTKTRSNPNQGRVYNPDGIAPTLNCMGGGNLEPRIIISDLGKLSKKCGDYMDSSEVKDGVDQAPKYKVRKLTQKECWRLMGFEDQDFEKAKSAMNENIYNGKDRSGSQLYKQAGNSIVVDVLSAIMRNLYTAMPYLFEDIKVGSFFSGIGAFEKALKDLDPSPL